MSDNEETVELSLDRYNELIDAEYLASSLCIAGVNNWGGYDEAIRIYKQFQSGEVVAHKFENFDGFSSQSFRDYATSVEGVDLSNPPEADAVFTAAMDNGASIEEGYQGLLFAIYQHYKSHGNTLGLSESELELWENYPSEEG
tara:strand:+ start:106 stop:534 length:429 start_codon:yes stop_codon:yes gene_type:complete